MKIQFDWAIKVHAASQWQKDITDILIIFQLYSVTGDRHVLNMFVLQAVNIIA